MSGKPLNEHYANSPAAPVRYSICAILKKFPLKVIIKRKTASTTGRASLACTRKWKGGKHRSCYGITVISRLLEIGKIHFEELLALDI
jgi:hypothetical protein